MRIDRTFVTTTLPYANSIDGGHIGHVFELVLADTYSRVFKNVFFNTGLDENGGKIAEAAVNYYPELTFQEALDTFRRETHENWRKLFGVYSIKPSRFYRTSSDKHKEFVLQIWKQFHEKGLIEIREYSGLYCQGCESFKTQQELVDGKCPDHPTTELQEVSEPNYFLTPSGRDHLKTLKITPKARIPEAEKILEAYEGISISRLHDPQSNLIQSPDEDHDIYVWFDALLNYIAPEIFYYNSGSTPSERKKEWKKFNTIQICGQDNLRFQSIIFQEILAHLGYTTTDRLLVHGIIRDENGQKLSKTLGNYVDPLEIAKEYSTGAVRLYLLCGIPTYSTSRWSNQDLVSLYNSWIVDGFGNLARRATVLVDKFGYGETLNPSIPFSIESGVRLGCGEKRFRERVHIYVEEFYKLVEQGDFNEAGKTIHSLVSYGNKYFNDRKPWDKSVSEASRKRILKNIIHLVSISAQLYETFLPEPFKEINEEISKWKRRDVVIEPVKWFQKLEQPEEV